MRYSSTEKQKNFEGKEFYKTTFYPVIYDDINDLYITVSDNTFLDQLSKKYYGSEQYWWVIALANNISNGKLSVSVGSQIRIPGNLERIINDLRNLN